MSVFQSHISSAEAIVSGYDGTVPFASHLKQYFSRHPKFGSRDRRLVSQYCYGYFRVSNLFPECSFSKIVLNSIFLTENAAHSELPDELNEIIHLSKKEKCSRLGINPQENFPLLEELSPEIDKMKFSLSLLHQPSLFIRIRPGKGDVVKRKLKEAAIGYHDIGVSTLLLKPQVKLQEILDIDREVVVQDLQSQRVFDQAGFEDLFSEKGEIQVWDCCAGSGGKSILLFDMFPGRVKITATDIRESILHNYRKRMKDAGVPLARVIAADLSKDNPLKEGFDLIVADVPCSGSGTWSRTPEQWHFFDSASLIQYQTRQRSIVSNATHSLREGGLFVYITCSVFRKENEDNRDHFRSFGLHLVRESLLAGMDENSDSMYVAVFRK
jgi:16S rRNA (cytosine967-C5)-methyltransferase